MSLAKYYVNENSEHIPIAHWAAKMVGLLESGGAVRYTLSQCGLFRFHAHLCMESLRESRELYRKSRESWPGIEGFLDALGDEEDVEFTRAQKALYKHLEEKHSITIDITLL